MRQLATKWATLAKLLTTLIIGSLILNLSVDLPTSPLHGIELIDLKKSLTITSISDVADGGDTSTTTVQQETVMDDNKGGFKRNLFYNIFLNSQTRVTFFRSLKIVDEQLQQIPNGTTVYFTLIGGERYYGNTGQNICHKYNGLNCVLLGDHTDGGEEQTLQPLYEFCVQHPNERVTYIHDKGSFRHSSGNIINRRRATLGAISDECLQMPLSANYGCNICGTKYQYKPHQIYQANMWTAECSYISQLTPPATYREKRQTLFESLWKGKHEKCLSRPPDPAMAYTPWAWNLTDAMFLRNVGLGRYALERWVLHHPSMIPCDLLPNATLKSLATSQTLTLSKPDEWGKFVSQKVKARATWLLQQEYAAFYPTVPINDVQTKDQAKPKPRPCW